MIQLQLYIEDQKVDLTEVTSIVIKDSIKKATDVGTLFTAYTRQFKVPASDTNNKIFKHFYSFKVLEGGFDARKKHRAIIKIEGADYQKGYIKLNEVELRSNKAHAYTIQFFGEITTLKDQLGESLLEDLDYLDRYNHEFDIDTVRDGFEQQLTYSGGSVIQAASGEVCYPLITHTKGFQFDTTNGFYDIIETGTPTSSDRLTHTDLKPAVKVRTVLTAIEQKFDITFGGDFIDEDMFNELWIWCHKNKGGIKTDDIDSNHPVYEGKIEDMTKDSFTKASDDPVGYDVEIYDQVPHATQDPNSDWDKYVDNGGNNEYVPGADLRDILTYKTGILGLNYTTYTGTVTITPDAAFTADYDLRFYSAVSGRTFIYEQGLNGASGALAFTIDETQNNVKLHDLQFRISSSALDEFDIDISITATRRATNSNGERTRVWAYSQTVTSAELITVAKIAFNLPKIKVIDFLRGIFKMFNLVAYAELDGLGSTSYTIMLEPLDRYYNNGKLIDISPYVDIETTTVERVTPYKTLKFEYQEASTFLLKNANEINRYEFGNLTFDPTTFSTGGDEYLFDGGEYKVELPFEKMMYERLLDGDDDTLSELMYGWFVNDFSENTPEPELGKPLLFFLKNRSCSTDSIEWSDATSSTVYNSANNVSSDLAQTINFNAEIDEYTLDINEESLYKTFYENFITGIYNINARRFKISAYLTPEFLFNYKLNSKLLISGTTFNIQEISSDLLTGRSTLDLLKMSADYETYDIEHGGCYSVYDYVDEDYWCIDFETKYSN